MSYLIPYQVFSSERIQSLGITRRRMNSPLPNSRLSFFRNKRIVKPFPFLCMSNQTPEEFMLSFMDKVNNNRFTKLDKEHILELIYEYQEALILGQGMIYIVPMPNGNPRACDYILALHKLLANGGKSFA